VIIRSKTDTSTTTRFVFASTQLRTDEKKTDIYIEKDTSALVTETTSNNPIAGVEKKKRGSASKTEFVTKIIIFFMIFLVLLKVFIFLRHKFTK